MRRNRMLMMMSLMLLAGTPSLILAEPAFSAALPSEASALVGKQVLGKSREFLGTIVAIDAEKKTADMKIPTGPVLTLALAKLSIEEDHVRAPDMSRGDVLVMVRQTGQQDKLEA